MKRTMTVQLSEETLTQLRINKSLGKPIGAEIERALIVLWYSEKNVPAPTPVQQLEAKTNVEGD